ncbi:DUF6907 domain-containing protein [Streptomyces sp. NPDC001984]
MKRTTLSRKDTSRPAIAAAALDRSGKVPHLVAEDAAEQTRQRAEQLADAGAREHTDGPLAVAQRGADWIAKYNCTPWCVMDHAGEDGEPGWHSGPTAEVTAPGDDERPPILSARVVTCNDAPEAFGVQTKIWFEVGDVVLELDAAQGHELTAAIKAFLPQFEEQCDRVAEAAVDDRPGDPEAQARYMAEVDARIKAVDTARLHELLAEHDITLVEAPVTESILAELDGNGLTFIVPPDAVPGHLLRQAQDAIEALAKART